MSVDTTSRVNLLQLWKKLQQSCPSMQSACIMLGAVAVTTLELTKQIQQLPAQQRVQAICSVGLKRSPEWERLWQCWHRTCLEWAMLRTIPWGSCSSKLWHSEPHSETHSETCFIFPEQCRSAACAYGSALERIWHRWKWCDWSQMRFSLWFFSFKAASQRCKSDNTRTSYHTQGDLCQRADLTTIQIELSLFADSLNSWIPRVVSSFCYLSRGIHIWCSLPPLPAWLVLSTLKRWSSACQHVACTQQPLWICRNESAPLTGGLHGPNAHLPLPPPHLGRKNSICFARRCFCFSIQDELWGLSWPAASRQPGAKKTKKVCRWEWPSTASKAANSRNSKLPRQPISSVALAGHL